MPRSRPMTQMPRSGLRTQFSMPRPGLRTQLSMLKAGPRTQFSLPRPGLRTNSQGKGQDPTLMASTKDPTHEAKVRNKDPTFEAKVRTENPTLKAKARKKDLNFKAQARINDSSSLLHRHPRTKTKDNVPEFNQHNFCPATDSGLCPSVAQSQ